MQFEVKSLKAGCCEAAINLDLKWEDKYSVSVKCKYGFSSLFYSDMNSFIYLFSPLFEFSYLLTSFSFIPTKNHVCMKFWDLQHMFNQ